MTQAQAVDGQLCNEGGQAGGARRPRPGRRGRVCRWVTARWAMEEGLIEAGGRAQWGKADGAGALNCLVGA